LLDAYFEARGDSAASGAKGRPKGGRKAKVELTGVPSYDDLVQIGKHISFTERRSEDAERELRRVKILELLQEHIGDAFQGVVTGITNFGVFIQLETYLIDGLIRYEDLMDDWWDVDERAGVVRGQRTGKKIGIGDVAQVRIVKVDLPRRELNLTVTQITARGGRGDIKMKAPQPGDKKHKPKKGKREHKGGEARRNLTSKRRGGGGGGGRGGGGRGRR
jgi:ribonuclease R